MLAVQRINDRYILAAAVRARNLVAPESGRAVWSVASISTLLHPNLPRGSGEDSPAVMLTQTTPMRRVAVRAFRSCQSTVRSHRGLAHLSHLRAFRGGSHAHPNNSSSTLLLQQSSINFSHAHAHTQTNTHTHIRTALRLASTSSPSSSRTPTKHDPNDKTQSSMNARRATVALVSGLVGYGAWYAYNDNSTDTASALTRGYSSSTQPDNAIPTRSLLVIGADELQTGTFVGEGPIYKTTDDEGSTVVEMLTPEQSTQKLRKMEESYFVNRGRGVLRYDLVQLPSNSPIEDDHAEKIVEVPSRAQAEPNDWMFWGVFDGHSYVFRPLPLSLATSC